MSIRIARSAFRLVTGYEVFAGFVNLHLLSGLSQMNKPFEAWMHSNIRICIQTAWALHSHSRRALQVCRKHTCILSHYVSKSHVKQRFTVPSKALKLYPQKICASRWSTEQIPVTIVGARSWSSRAEYTSRTYFTRYNDDIQSSALSDSGICQIMCFSWSQVGKHREAPGCQTGKNSCSSAQKRDISVVVGLMNELWQPARNVKLHHTVEDKNNDQGMKLPYLPNEIWHKIFAATDLETCRANRIAFHDLLSRDWDAAWKFLFPGSEKDGPRPLKSPRDWPMMILLLREKKIPEALRNEICEKMARYKNSVLLKEARQAGCPWNGDVVLYAAFYGSLECLRWAHENGCKTSKSEDSYAFTAASFGFLDVLKYLHQNDFSWNETTIRLGLVGGHLNCLKFAHENGCPWSSFRFTAERYHTKSWSNNHWECVQYLINAGCPQLELSVPIKWWVSSYISLHIEWNAQPWYWYSQHNNLHSDILDGNLPSWTINGPLRPLTVASKPFIRFVHTSPCMCTSWVLLVWQTRIAIIIVLIATCDNETLMYL